MQPTDQHSDVINLWKRRESVDYAYFEHVESLTAVFWDPSTLFRQWFETIDRTELLEIACGQGRQTLMVPEGYQRIFAIDTSVDGIAIAKERFKVNPKLIACLSEDGMTIPQPDSSFTGAFSYDAMVHFEPITMATYLRETARVLKPGGRALFHHSVYDKNPTQHFTQSPHWRNYMTPELFAHFASRAGLHILQTVAFPWSEGSNTDGLTLMEKSIA